ncbi:MAG: hypothetical protein QHH26_00580 [Armatimonadota bacterium]|nr:hypothetical protein [Armatimonadota bacterium]
MKKHMPTVSRVLFAACLIVVFANGVQAADVEYIKSKLDFRFVANPNSTTGTAQRINVQQVLDGSGSGAPYTGQSCDKFRKIIKAACGGTVPGADCNHFRNIIERLLRITEKTVTIYFIDDLNTSITNTSPTWYDACLDSGHAWPCSYAGTDTTPASITFGSYWLNDTSQFPDFNSILATFCHELMHAQDLSEDRTHMYGNYYYGADENHYFIEAIPDMSMTYKEGIANMVGFYFYGRWAEQAISWFTRNGFIIVEKTVPPGYSSNLFLYSMLKQAGVPEITSGADFEYFKKLYGSSVASTYGIFRIRSLPADIIKQNERIIALILYNHGLYTSFDDVFEAIQQVNPSLYRTCDSAFARLVEALCSQRASPQVESSPDEYLLTLALCDYFTCFKSQTQNEFASVFENMLDSQLIQAYWEKRDQIKAAVDINHPAPGDIFHMSEALGITSTHSRTAP